ncbi:hypothetical protein ABB37_02921 [Leptomonas pyrrhocoris]|uniref:TLC domain-containing protein n=1 Tax=Leptomonas pyrrhocoris TaxID=157538 RepID=A0A0N0DXV3_LEPPY|nr:hypothetical protein ABB37_02921 [Leptomonas pyrrhocoris]KPA83242.1 hypothetical protein ABB37_02921 [Leptomonas pyrrhocoris]|eukprot:XP_015661681.1 hypothetical protein ABB37_02921 [Leptomonas pyrrhocoris]
MLWDAPSDALCSREASGLPVEMRCTILVIWVVFFSVSFCGAWAAFERYSSRFRSYDVSKQADNCSRVSSSIHSLIVAPSLLYGLCTMSWSSTYEPQDSSSFLQATLLVSAGYLLFDLYVVLTYRIPRWTTFAIHHIMAMIPYMLYYFTCCNYGLYLLSIYMLVEITNVPLNTVMWMQESGHSDGVLYALVLHLTAAMWIVFRIASPLWCLYASYKTYLPAVHYPTCLLPSQLCGILVNVFCCTGFFVVIAKDVAEYWNRPAKPVVAKS